MGVCMCVCVWHGVLVLGCTVKLLLQWSPLGTKILAIIERLAFHQRGHYREVPLYYWPILTAPCTLFLHSLRFSWTHTSSGHSKEIFWSLCSWDNDSTILCYPLCICCVWNVSPPTYPLTYCTVLYVQYLGRSQINSIGYWATKKSSNSLLTKILWTNFELVSFIYLTKPKLKDIHLLTQIQVFTHATY